MKVIRADYAGACYGVQRALDLAMQAALEPGTACTLGPLIHNPGVVARLEERGVSVADEVADIACDTVVIRSHGVTPEVRDELYEKGVNVVDATCPHVLRAQQAAAKLASDGCRVLVVGEDGHPEVEGLCAYARRQGAKVDVVSSPEDVPDDMHASIGIVVQTTQRREKLDAVVDEIKKKGIEPIVKSTICYATTQRQDAARALAGEVDAVVVIGGRNSSNTTRLAEICSASCPKTFHIESTDELDKSWFDGCLTIGVTAGASTPEEQISEVVLTLERM